MLKQSLTTFNPETATLLGEGSEARVYALDYDHVLRFCREGASAEGVAARIEHLEEVAQGASHLPFATPTVLESAIHEGQHVTLEKRLHGQPLQAVLADLHGSSRQFLLNHYMETAWLIGDIEIERPYFGELCHADPIHASGFRNYMDERASRSLAVVPELVKPDSIRLAANVAELDDRPRFVHLDYCPANVMVTGNRITAVIDFGYGSLIGDRRMTMVAAAAYLVPEITPTVQKKDQAHAFDWLRQHEMLSYYTAAERWLAAYWASAVDDVNLHAWCKKILG